jgi:hypothetical protein
MNLLIMSDLAQAREKRHLISYASVNYSRPFILTCSDDYAVDTLIVGQRSTLRNTFDVIHDGTHIANDGLGLR